MVDATPKIGMRVSADVSALRPDVGFGVGVPGEVIGITHDRITVRVDTPINGEDVFEVPPERVQPLGW
jgi:hypothetical protein